MGNLQASEMASYLPMESALVWHLQSNHYPPISDALVPVAMEAIERANERDWDSDIVMPNGVTLRVEAIVEQLHLDFWIEE